MSQKNEQWTSRWGFLAASMGMAIGTGNIWRFPRELGENGGGPFLIAWTIAMLILAVPVLMGELVIGKKTRLGTIGAFRDFVGKKNTWMGTWVALVCLAILCVYAVVMGWCIKYFTLALTGTFKTGMTVVETQAIWDSFISNPAQVILFQFIGILLSGIIVFRGVNDGIEKASKIMIPGLFILLLGSAIRAMTMPGAAKGLEFMFTPNLHMLGDYKIWLAAFTQAAWSTGAGWGMITTYAVYTNKKEDVAGNAFIMGVGDNVGALLAALVVIPTIFALSPSLEAATQTAQTGGAGLTFVALTQLFANIPGGNIVGALFFMAMSLAALSSFLPMVETEVLNIMNLGIDRKKTTLIIMIVAFILGIPSAYSTEIFANQDNVSGLGLFFSGLLYIYAMVKYGAEKIRENEINHANTDLFVGKWFSVFLYVTPIIILLVLFQFIPELWKAQNRWDITSSWSLGTLLFQYFIYLVISVSTMGYFNRKIVSPIIDEEICEEV